MCLGPLAAKPRALKGSSSNGSRPSLLAGPEQENLPASRSGIVEHGLKLLLFRWIAWLSRGGATPELHKPWGRAEMRENGSVILVVVRHFILWNVLKEPQGSHDNSTHSAILPSIESASMISHPMFQRAVDVHPWNQRPACGFATRCACFLAPQRPCRWEPAEGSCHRLAYRAKHRPENEFPSRNSPLARNPIRIDPSSANFLDNSWRRFTDIAGLSAWVLGKRRRARVARLPHR